MILGLYPELVKSDRIPAQPARPLQRMKNLPPTSTGIWWYSDYPDHYAGDASVATKEKGQTLVRLLVDNLAQYIAAVKADTVVPTLNREFFDRVERVGSV
jgi:creatinine amidohydrolase